MKTLGAIVIDEKNDRFKVCYKEFSLPRTLLTWGIIRHKTIKSPWIPYSKMVSFSSRTDSERHRSGLGVGTGIGSLGVGGSTSVSKSVTSSAEIVITLDDLNRPYVTIPIMKKPLKGRKFDKAQKLMDDTNSALNYIVRHRQ